MTAFDPAAWYRQARDAGDSPHIILQRDGRETICRTVFNIDYEKCPDWPGTEPEQAALRNYLATIGRYLDARTIAS